MSELPVLSVPWEVYSAWVRSGGKLLLRFQSHVIGEAEMLKRPVYVGRGPSGALAERYLAKKGETEND